jgi:hypothetical protein
LATQKPQLVYSIKNLKPPEVRLYGRSPIPVLPEVDFIEEVVSITEDWSENEIYMVQKIIVFRRILSK